jgi:hypothetical protein
MQQKAIAMTWCYPVWGFGPDLAYLSVFNLMGIYAFMMRLASDAR